MPVAPSRPAQRGFRPASPLVGVLGAGQLGRMLALAGAPLGLRFRFYDASTDAAAGSLAELVVGRWDDEARLRRFARGLDVATYEFENVPARTVGLLRRLGVRVEPKAAALEAGQDRLAEKTLFRSLGIPTVPFAPVSDLGDLEQALGRVGLPAVLKTRRLGYDGKGQAVVRTRDEARAAWSRLGLAPCLLEGFLRFDRELSMLAVRGRRGAPAFYPLVENVHEGGILRLSLAPAEAGAALERRARLYSRRLLEKLGYVGVLAVELFERGGKLFANELAPRVHNSGHWTIEGAEASQFENHLRAVVGWPLGSTESRGACAMANLIGAMPRPEAVLAVEGARLHDYGKAPRPGRKLGHVTFVARDRRELRTRLRLLSRATKNVYNLLKLPPGRRPG